MRRAKEELQFCLITASVAVTLLLPNPVLFKPCSKKLTLKIQRHLSTIKLPLSVLTACILFLKRGDRQRSLKYLKSILQSLNATCRFLGNICTFQSPVSTWILAVAAQGTVPKPLLRDNENGQSWHSLHFRTATLFSFSSWFITCRNAFYEHNPTEWPWPIQRCWNELIPLRTKLSPFAWPALSPPFRLHRLMVINWHKQNRGHCGCVSPQLGTFFRAGTITGCLCLSWKIIWRHLTEVNCQNPEGREVYERRELKPERTMLWEKFTSEVPVHPPSHLLIHPADIFEELTELHALKTWYIYIYIKSSPIEDLDQCVKVFVM